MRKKTSIKKRLLSFVEKSDTGCWIWKGAKGNNNYGRFKIDGKLFLPHRVSYSIFNGEIPKGLVVCHSCDNVLCINPKHLFIGTLSDNMKDCYKKGRLHINKYGFFKRGHNITRAISENEVLLIREKIKSGQKLVEISKDMNIKYQIIRNISCGRCYFNVK